MLRKLSVLVGLILLSCIAAHAQGLENKFELYGGYSYDRFKSDPAVNLNGWEFSGQYKLTDWLGGVADVTGEYGKVGGVGSRVYTYVFGPQLTWPRSRRISPFAHVLGGLGHFSGGDFTSRSFALAIGAGIDTKLSNRISWRLIQFDYLPTHLGHNTQDSERISTGLVLRF